MAQAKAKKNPGASPSAKQNKNRSSLPWDRIRKLRSIRRINSALKDLSIQRLFLLLPGGRPHDDPGCFFEYPFIRKSDPSFFDILREEKEGSEFAPWGNWRPHGSETKAFSFFESFGGIQNLLVPIPIGGEVLGYFAIGQFLNTHDDATRENILRQLAGQMKVSEKIRKSFKEIPVYSTEKVEILATLLQSMTSEIEIFTTEEKLAASKKKNLEDFNRFGILSQSKAVKKVLAQIPEIARSNSSVMIYGESGTGKERLAHIIHELSDRKEQAMVTINCAALTETILEAELFGFRKGSFTNAFADKEGLFEKAHQGTMFLDEVGDMPSTLQVKLLRVLQEGTFIKVGDTEAQKVDVRIIAATNKSISDLVERGVFRQDLYYRLAVIELILPPLRERKEDIEMLMDFFLDRFCQKMKKEGVRFSQEAMDFMLAYEWHGNIRELQNEIERSVALASNHSIIGPDDLSKRLTELPTISNKSPTGQRTLKEMVSEYERALIKKALQEEKWNKTKISEKLGLTRQGLLKKIEKYKLEKRKNR